MFMNFIHISLHDISLMHNILYRIKRDVAVWKKLGCPQHKQRTWWQMVRGNTIYGDGVIGLILYLLLFSCCFTLLLGRLPLCRRHNAGACWSWGRYSSWYIMIWYDKPMLMAQPSAVKKFHFPPWGRAGAEAGQHLAIHPFDFPVVHEIYQLLWIECFTNIDMYMYPAVPMPDQTLYCGSSILLS